MPRLKTLGDSQTETSEHLTDDWPYAESDASTGVTIGVLLGVAFLCGIAASVLVYEGWLFFHAWSCRA